MDRRIWVLGDSIGQGAWDLEGGFVARIKKEMNEKVINGSESIWIKNLSESGDTTDNSLEKLRKIDPNPDKDVLILQTGVNDALYDVDRGSHWIELPDRKNILKEFLNESDAKFKDVIVVGEPYTYVEGVLPWDQSLKLEDKTVKKYDQIKQKITNERDHSFVELRSDNREEWEKYSYDGVHLNTEGHQMLYQELSNELNKFIP